MPDHTLDELVALLRDRSFRKGDFRLSSGRRSPYYVDARATTMSSRLNPACSAGRTSCPRQQEIPPGFQSVRWGEATLPKRGEKGRNYSLMHPNLKDG